MKNIEFLWCVFKSFVSADELLLKFHVATFNLSSESKEENAKHGAANENVKQSSGHWNMNINMESDELCIFHTLKLLSVAITVFGYGQNKSESESM